MELVNRKLVWCAAALLAVGCGKQGSEVVAPANGAAAKPRVAFVTNCAVDFWTIGQRGAEAAAREFGCELTVRMPPNGTAEEQQRILEDLLAAGMQGVALSPKDPTNMKALIERVAKNTVLITHDSDAPGTSRLCYIGVDNYDAGRMCGKLIADTLPKGGKIVLLVGTLDQDNARSRRQGLIDELLGRSHDRTRFDAQDAVLKNERFEIAATFTTGFEGPKAKAAAQDALTRWPDLAGMVGLFAYEPPQILDAVRAARRLDTVKVFGFDEDNATLKGIAAGEIVGSVVQDPYHYGYRSIELLAKLLREGDAGKREALLPKDRFLLIPARVITRANLTPFWDDLKKKIGQ